MNKKEYSIIILMILVLVYIAYNSYSIIPETINSDEYKTSIFSVLVNAFMTNAKTAMSITFFVICIGMILAFVIFIFQSYNPLKALRLMVFVLIAVSIYTFFSIIILLSIKPDNAEAMLALLGFMYGFTKFLPFMYKKVKESITYA
ncbi:hypothetical protein [Macrococcus equipercicus]|uniref:Uncharacterized protein n=1 Tax=Macrococcus equipercicus TaxID=69967 RepID=A0A9Q9BUJ9_9STAP|nr:hypothetical protein [Macrococcus equipercicus]UTH14754.1 hypothetical protein KFV11_05230 [Macrococcus equipercicus]